VIPDISDALKKIENTVNKQAELYGQCRFLKQDGKKESRLPIATLSNNASNNESM